MKSFIYFSSSPPNYGLELGHAVLVWQSLPLISHALALTAALFPQTSSTHIFHHSSFFSPPIVAPCISLFPLIPSFSTEVLLLLFLCLPPFSLLEVNISSPRFSLGPLSSFLPKLSLPTFP